MVKIVIATKNPGKAAEIREILSGLDVEVKTLADYPELEMPPEDGVTFEENALKKARYVSSATGIAALADDSGLEVDALGRRPGIYSARYAGEDATDRDNYEKLLEELKETPSEERTARFRCAAAFVTPEGVERVFDGTLEGVIAESPVGTGGFGYDPVFYLSERGSTVAELPSGEKNEISHRGAALRKFREWLASKEV